MLTKKEQELLDAFEAGCADNGVEIVTVEVIGSKKAPIIRVYIDAEGGISFTELSDAQEWIGKLCDEIDPFPGAYTLEVSSPGIDRPLRTVEHFQRYAGEDVAIRTRAQIEGRMNFKGLLKGVDDSNVYVEIEGTDYEIPMSEIKRANIVGKIDF